MIHMLELLYTIESTFEVLRPASMIPFSDEWAHAFMDAYCENVTVVYGNGEGDLYGMDDSYYDTDGYYLLTNVHVNPCCGLSGADHRDICKFDREPF